MMQNNEKNYYEILQIAQGANPKEIEDAYRKARGLYSEGNMAVYSLYTAEERKEKLALLESIFETLMDPARRSAYDSMLRGRRDNIPQASEKVVDLNSVNAGKDIFEEYTEVGAFKDKISFKQPLLVMENTDPMIAEKYRILYTKIEQISLKNSYKTFAITSAVKGEGKTMTALNLSYVMATEFKKKVLLIEGDFRNPSISSNYLDMGRLYGLVDVIKGEIDLRSAINRLEGTNLYFLPARCSVKNSSVLLDSPNMKTVLDSVKGDFDYVIVDSPPILPLVDMNILSKSVDALMLIVRAGKTPKDLVKKAVNSLPKHNLMGIVLNGAAEHMMKYSY